ncbi:MAG: hypothetical protein NVSMB57_06620 [Actinomycetota bacterium]
MPKLRTSALLLLFSTIVLGSLSSHAAERRPHNDISIEWDGELDAAHGVVSGAGTRTNPYVISGWNVGTIAIKDTTKAITIKGNTITGTLRLNWIGEHVMVMDNDIADLRVNENTPRWGDPTGGDFENNTFGQVGQLRHFDGMFMHNTVGAPPSGDDPLSQRYPDTEAVNFDGFDGAHFAFNTIYGFVEARLHGHHHASKFGGRSHMHADGPHSMEKIDHTRRFHEVMIESNTIYASGPFALEYIDTDHAANDRTAASETNPYLNAPHTHLTRIHIRNNTLNGSGLLINVFNAPDERHKGEPRGSLDLIGNTINLDRDPAHPMAAEHGIDVREARYLKLLIRGNTISGAKPLTGVALIDGYFQSGSGIMLNVLDHAAVLIEKTKVSNRATGVSATHLSRSVNWRVRGLITENVGKPVAYDSSVVNPPKEG